MALLCTIDQYLERYEVPDGVTDACIEEVLEEASDAVQAELDAAGIDLDTATGEYVLRVMRVTRSVAHRAMSTAESVPFGASQYTTTEGPYTTSFTLGNPYGDVFVTSAEKARLGIGSVIGFAGLAALHG